MTLTPSSGKMVETTLNQLLKNVSAALGITSDTLGGIKFTYTVDKVPSLHNLVFFVIDSATR
jgi:hypothetical protein